MKKKKRLLNFITRRKNAKLFATLFNIYVAVNRFLRGAKSWKIVVKPEGQYFKVTDNENRIINILHSERIGFYKFGIKPRIAGLLDDYFINPNEIQKGDTVIDCGANIGEIGLGLRLFGKEPNYIAFEPGRREAELCERNNPGGICEKLALWYEKTTLEFYEMSKSADSSLIEFDGYRSVTKVTTTTLNDYCTEHEIEKIKVLKIEGEGAEPEILRGADKILHNVKYICIDCGPERGYSKKETLPEVKEFLNLHGFKLQKLNESRLTALFAQNSLTTPSSSSYFQDTEFGK